MLRAKTLKRLIIITTICSVPVILFAVKGGVSAIKSKNALFMPDLLKKPEQIVKITLQDNKQTLTLQKQDKVWEAKERSNYHINNDKVSQFLYSLADLKIIEPKTANPEFYKQLDVNDVTEPDSQALLVTITDMYNDNIVKLYIGKREGVRLGEEYQEHMFVRKAGDNQTWLVQGTLPFSNEFCDWVEQPLIGLLDGDQIRNVIIEQPSLPTITISKTEQKQEDFVLMNIQPKSGMVLDLDAVNTVPFEIAELEFSDVKPNMDDIIWDKEIVTTIDTFTGVRVTLSLVKVDSKVFAKVSAVAANDATPEITAKVTAYNNDRKRWIYELSPDIYKELTLSQNDFFKQKETLQVGHDHQNCSDPSHEHCHS